MAATAAAGARSRDAMTSPRVNRRWTLRSWHSPRALIDGGATHQSDRGERAEQIAAFSSHYGSYVRRRPKPPCSDFTRDCHCARWSYNL